MMKRILYVFVVLLAICCNKADDGGDKPLGSSLEPIEVEEGKDLVGYILYSDGTRAEGVVVSDGFSCTVTNEKGVYQLARNDKARHVFFSYPNNCEITFDGNAVPEYYFKLPAKTNTALRHDFTLKKSGQIPPSKFVLYLIADSQVKLPYMESRFVDDIVADINADVAGRNYPCIAVTLGDDGDDNLYHVSKGTTTTTFKTVSNLYGHLKIPCFHCIGNHDHDKTIASGDDYYYRSLSSYEEAFSPVNYSFNFGNVHFVVMDDVRYTAPSTYTSGLLDEQVEWLRQDLSYVPTDRQVYVCLHIPIRGAASFQNRDALFDLLKPYPLKRIFAGHSHYNHHYIHTKHDNLHEWIVSAAHGLFWRGIIAKDGSYNGYGVCVVGKNGAEDEYYKSAKFDKSVQGRMLDPSKFTTWKDGRDNDNVRWTDKVICNIWNSDNQTYYKWKVELYEDGKKTMDMSLRNCQDYSVSDWIDMYTEFKSINNTHNCKIWRAVPVSKTSVKKVRAVDPYGNEYWITDVVNDPSVFVRY